MKTLSHLSLVSSLFITTLVLAGCSTSTNSTTYNDNVIAPSTVAPNEVTTEDGLTVVTTLPALYSIALNVTDSVFDANNNAVEVVNLLPPGASPHTFSPTPSDIKLLQEADVLVTTGFGAEEFIADIVNSANNEELYVIDFTDVVTTVSADEDSHDDHDEDEHDDHDDEEDHDDHDDEAEDTEQVHAHDHSIDPHIWLSPSNAMAITEHIADELARIDATNATIYSENSDIYVAQLAAFDNDAAETLASVSYPNFIPLHPGWSYFAEAYGLEQITAIELIPGQEPSAKQIVELIEEIEENNVVALFTEPQLEARIVDQIANEVNVEVYEIDPLGTPLENADGELTFSKDTYIDTMQLNVDTFATALQ